MDSGTPIPTLTPRPLFDLIFRIKFCDPGTPVEDSIRGTLRTKHR